MNAPTERDVKKLFALSMNQCAFPGCINFIFTLKDEMIGEICHIKAKNKEGPRFDHTQTGEERHGFDNLILLCRNHHKIVDDQPQKYTAEWLKTVKHGHESNGVIEITQEDARLARKLLDSYLHIEAQGEAQIIVNSPGATQIKNIYQRPPKVQIVVERRPGSVTVEEERQISSWIKELAEGEIRKTLGAAFAMWWSRFHFRFAKKTEDLPSSEMENVEAWYLQQRAIQKRGLKLNAPDLYRGERIKAIKAAMNQMGKTNETYYPMLSKRLKMRKPFISLKDLTKRDLDRIYTMVLRNARDG